MSADLPPVAVLAGLGALTAYGGSLGGIGGATLLVPVLLALGVEPVAAAPLGLITVAATSLAAASRQIDDGLVHHRLGLTVETSASVGAVLGALASTSLPQEWLARVLGIGALIGAVATLARRGVRNRPVAVFADDTPGEWPGTLGGTYRHGDEAVPYQATRVPLGLAACLVAGAVAGMAGVGGGFLKTPAMSEVMRVPVKVAAATSTFTLGLTAATGLLVFAAQGRIDPRPTAAVALGALAGAALGARLQSRLPAPATRAVTGALLVAVGVVVLWRTR